MSWVETRSGRVRRPGELPCSRVFPPRTPHLWMTDHRSAPGMWVQRVRPNALGRPGRQGRSSALPPPLAPRPIVAPARQLTVSHRLGEPAHRGQHTNTAQPPRTSVTPDTFSHRFRRRWNETPLQWHPIPVGLGAMVLVALMLWKQQRAASSQATPDDGDLGPTGVRVKGAWQVHVLGALPLRSISRMYGAFNSYELPVWFRTPGYRFYAYLFGVDLDECDPSDLTEYRSLSEFFMRKLKPGLRPVDDALLVSPADGRVVNFGTIENRRIASIKGATYSMDALLGGRGPIINQAQPPPTPGDRLTTKANESGTSVDEEEFAHINGIEYSLDDLIGDEQHHRGDPHHPHDDPAPEHDHPDATRHDFDDGPSTSLADHAHVALTVAQGNMPWTVKGVPRPGNKMFFAVVYLAPGDYHRFHSPTAWVAERRRHFAGELFSVSPFMVKRLADLFVLNERVALLGRWRHGFFSMTAVGATNVGSIRVHFDKDLHTNERGTVKQAGTFSEATYARASAILNGQPLRAADEMGGFWLGSTIVLVFEAPEDFRFDVGLGEKVRVGQRLGDVSKS